MNEVLGGDPVPRRHVVPLLYEQVAKRIANIIDIVAKRIANIIDIVAKRIANIIDNPLPLGSGYS